MDEQTLKSIIRMFANKGREVLDLVLCTVDEGSVDTENWTCSGTPISGDNGALLNGANSTASIDGIQLTAQQGSNGIIQIPSDGSQILVLTTVRLDSYVILCSGIAGYGVYYQRADGTYAQMLIGVAPNMVSGADIQLNDGSFGGLVEIMKLTNKLNNLVGQLQGELTKIASGIATAGGAYTPGQLSLFSKEDYENTLIIHGK